MSAFRSTLPKALLLLVAMTLLNVEIALVGAFQFQSQQTRETSRLHLNFHSNKVEARVPFAFTPSIISIIPMLPTSTSSRPRSTTSLASFSDESIFTDIDTFYKSFPYTAAFMTCSIKASAADFLAQFRERKDLILNMEEEQKQSTTTTTTLTTLEAQQVQEGEMEQRVEYDRNLAFILYGGLYQGISQNYIYNVLFPLWFGSGQDIPTVAIKVAFDLMVITPFLCLPVAYLTKAVIFETTLQEGLRKYVNDLRYEGLLGSYYKIWFPAQICTFGFVPEHLRIAFIASVSFFWLILLSSISSSEMQEQEE